jgi:hypothetical protein
MIFLAIFGADFSFLQARREMVCTPQCRLIIVIDQKHQKCGFTRMI